MGRLNGADDTARYREEERVKFVRLKGDAIKQAFNEDVLSHAEKGTAIPRLATQEGDENDMCPKRFAKVQSRANQIVREAEAASARPKVPSKQEEDDLA